MTLFKIEGIPGPAAKAYSVAVARSRIVQDFYREVVEEVSARQDTRRVLDIGTGPGYVPLKIARKSRDIEIKAVDISAAMVRVARQNAAQAGLSGRVEFQHGRAESIPFPDGHFDLVISTLSFHHWARPVECLKEISRVLKSGGEAWVYDLRRDVTKDVKAGLRRRYGWFLSFVTLYIVRSHSSVKLREFGGTASPSEIGFSRGNVEDRGIILKLRLLK